MGFVSSKLKLEEYVSLLLLLNKGEVLEVKGNEFQVKSYPKS